MDRVLRLVPIVLYCAAIFALSSLPRLPETVSWMPDKIGHVILYSGLGWLVARELKLRGVAAPYWLWVGSAVFCLAYGITDEVHQYFVPGRSFQLGDLVADTAGGLIGGGVYSLWLKKTRVVTR